MTRYLFRLPALLLALGAATIGFCPSYASAEETCGDYGTTVIFANSPAEAAKQALQEEKLVFVLHVSGNFETPEFT